MNVMEQINREQIDKVMTQRSVPEFKPGDTVRVQVRVVEGQRTRLQAFEGVCIARRNADVNSTLTLRKISFGEGVERVFPLYSPVIEGIEVVRRGKVRRAKLYYLRGRRGRSARIAEDTAAMLADKAEARKQAKADADAKAEAKAAQAAEAAAQAEAEAAAAKAEAEAAKAEAAAAKSEAAAQPEETGKTQ